jgi:cytochrome c553
MNKITIVLCMFFGVASVVHAADTPEYSKAIKTAVGFCGDCHGRDGNSTSPQFPKLAGQPRKFLELQIGKMQTQARTNQTAKDYMWGPAHRLDAASINEIAAYFSRQSPMLGTVDYPNLATQGKALYHASQNKKEDDSCASCHGTKGEGEGKEPRLAGQHRHYLIRQLVAVEAKQREVPSEMSAATHALSEAEREAIAEYLQAPN